MSFRIFRLVQLLHETSTGWRAIPDVLNSMWGPALEIRQQQPMPRRSQKQDQQAQSGRSTPAGPPSDTQRNESSPVLVLVLFLGGVSHAEIAAVRRLNDMERNRQTKSERDPTDKRQYLIVTTEILTPRKLFRSMIDDVD